MGGGGAPARLRARRRSGAQGAQHLVDRGVGQDALVLNAMGGGHLEIIRAHVCQVNKMRKVAGET